MSINFLFWNARGIANATTRNVIKRLIKLHNIIFLAIIEPFTRSNLELYSRTLGLDFMGSNENGKIWIFVEQGHTFLIEDD